MSKPSILKSLGSSRIRSQDFKNYRKDKGLAFRENDPRRNIINNSNPLGFQEFKQDNLPPEWVDSYENIKEKIYDLESKRND